MSNLWQPNVEEESALRRVERDLEKAVRRGFQPMLDFVLRNWERELPISAIAARADGDGLSVALRFAIGDEEWDRFLPNLAREMASLLGVSLDMGAQDAKGSIPGVVVDWDLGSPEAVRWMRSWSLDLARGLLQTTRDELRETLARGLELGESRDELAGRVRNLSQDMAEWRSKLIAQTETIRAYNQGHLQAYKASGVVDRLRWLDGQPGACELCQALDQQEVVLGELFEGGIDAPPRHPGCLPGDALVTTCGRITAGSKRWYEGNVVLLRTAVGNELTITPNHPVLSDRGWVAAKLLQPGDNVFCSANGQRVLPIYPDYQEMPACIEDIMRALVGAFGMASRTVPTTPEDFHGDGGYSEVDIIGPKWKLRGYGDAELAEHISQLDLITAHVATMPYPKGNPLSEAPVLSFASSGGMGSLDLPCSLCRRHARPFEALGLGLTSDMNTAFQQVAADCATINPHHLSGSVLRQTGLIERDYLISIEILAFHGWVYNLQTEIGWYAVTDSMSHNGIIVHNCRCDSRGIVSTGRG